MCKKLSTYHRCIYVELSIKIFFWVKKTLTYKMSECIERKPSLIKNDSLYRGKPSLIKNKWKHWGKPSLIKNDWMYREKKFSNWSFSTTPMVIGREFLMRILPCQHSTATRTFRFFRFGHNLGIFVLLDLIFYPRSKWVKPNPKQNCPILPWLCPKQKI